jgi:hypothetical protein
LETAKEDKSENILIYFNTRYPKTNIFLHVYYSMREMDNFK